MQKNVKKKRSLQHDALVTWYVMTRPGAVGLEEDESATGDELPDGGNQGEDPAEDSTSGQYARIHVTLLSWPQMRDP